MLKNFLVFACLLLSLSCFSQRIFYSDTRIIDIRTRYNLVGKVKDNIVVWTTRIKDNRPEVLVFDDRMLLKKSVKLNRLKDLAEPSFFYNKDRFYVAAGQKHKKTMLLKVFCFDDNASLQSEIIMDSIDQNSLTTLVYNFFQTPDRNTICYIKSEINATKEVLNFDCRFTDGKSMIKKNFGLPFNFKTDILTGYSIDKNRNVYFLKTTNKAPADYTIQISKGDYTGKTMLYAEKNINDLILKNIRLVTPGNKCIVYGEFFSAKPNQTVASGAINNIFLWQTDDNLKDAPGDSLFIPVKQISRLHNVTSQGMPTYYFYAAYDSLFSEPTVSQKYYTTTINYYDDPRAKTTSISYDVASKVSGYSVYKDYAYEFDETTSALTKRLDIFNLAGNNYISEINSLHTSDAENGNGNLYEAKVIRSGTKTGVLFPVQIGKRKNLIEYIAFAKDGKPSKIPVTAWRDAYHYLLGAAIETDDGLLLPCTKGSRIFFAKINL